MEKYTTVLDWKTKYCEDVISLQIELQIQSKPILISTGLSLGHLTSYIHSDHNQLGHQHGITVLKYFPSTLYFWSSITKFGSFSSLKISIFSFHIAFSPS